MRENQGSGPMDGTAKPHTTLRHSRLARRIGAFMVSLVALLSFTQSQVTAVPETKADSTHGAATAAVQPEVGGDEARPSYGRLPLSFERNLGQASDTVEYQARGRGYSLFLQPTGVSLALRATSRKDSASPTRDVAEPGHTIRMRFLESHAEPAIEAEVELPGKINYLIGSDSSRWRTDIPTYARVRYRAVYPGVDLVFYGRNQELEYDVVVAPGADPTNVKFSFDGVDRITVDAEGELVLDSGSTQFRQRRPIAYQLRGEHRTTVSASYAVDGSQVGFVVGPYDSETTLVIDPVLDYSTYLGGSSTEAANAVAVDSAGNVYVAGSTTSTNFPTVNALQANTGDAHAEGRSDVFVSKIDPDGTTLLFSTYLGGEWADQAAAITVDSTQNVYLTGSTRSFDFPTTAGVVQGSHLSPVDGFPPTAGAACASTAFVAKIDASGNSLQYSTYLGGTGNGRQGDGGGGIAVDSSGAVYVGGTTSSAGFPVSAALQPKLDGNVLVRSADGGTSWNPSETGLPKRDVRSVVFDPKTPSTIYVNLLGGELWKSTDGGATWALLASPLLGADLDLLVVDPINNDNLYAASSDARLTTLFRCGPQLVGVRKSDDGGATWSNASLGLPVDRAPAALAMDPQNPLTLYVAFGQPEFSPLIDVFWKTTDGGATWAQSATGIPAIASGSRVLVDTVTPSIVYLSTYNHGTYKSVDGGASWALLGGSVTSFDQPIALSSSSPSTLYEVGFFGLRKSTDGGLTWAEAVKSPCPVAEPIGGYCGFPFAPVVSIVVDPGDSSTVYVGSSIGVFKSTDGAGSWQPLVIPGTHLPPLGTQIGRDTETRVGAVLAVDPSSSSTVLAALAVQPDGFVTKLNPTGTSIDVSTFLGGSHADRIHDLTMDASGSILVTGTTRSASFPTTPSAFQATRPLAGLELCDFGGVAACDDAFVTQLSAGASALAYSTFLGGAQDDSAAAIAVDPLGAAYVTGFTGSDDFPVLSAFQTALHPSGSAFVTKLHPLGNALGFSTFLGHASGRGIAVDASGAATVVGSTNDPDFPLEKPIQCFQGVDAFATRLQPSGAALDYSTFLSGSGSDFSTDVALDSNGDAHIVGQTGSTNWETHNALFPALQGSSDAFVTKISVEGASGSDIGVLKCQTSASGSFLNGFSTNVGDPITYTLYINNSGPLDATGVGVTDPLPAGVDLVSASPGCTGTTTVTCAIGNLAQQAGVVRTLIVVPNLPGAITNQATVASTSADADTTNNASQKTANVIAGPLAIACPLTTSGVVGQAYSSALIGSGGTPPFTYSISTGSLPGGLSLAPGTGAITGSPSTPGITNFTAEVTDSATPAQNRTADCTITVETVLAVPGTIRIVKNAVPKDPQDFQFTGNLGTFTLDDDSDPTLPRSRTFSGLAAPASYSVTETALPGWSLMSVSCVDRSGGTTIAGSTATIGLAAGETVTCTFENAQEVDPCVSGVTATGSGIATLCLENATINCKLEDVAFVPLAGHGLSPPANSAPANLAFPDGLVSFRVGAQCLPGAVARLSLTLPVAQVPGTRYWKYGPTPANPTPSWHSLTTTVSGNDLSFSLTDGGLGDADLTANGVIFDPGGPAQSTTIEIPTLSTTSLWVFFVILGALGIWAIRRSL